MRRRVAEITKDGGAQAAGGFGVGDHAPQFLALDVLPARNLRRIDGDVRAARSVIARPIDEELARFDVGVVPQQRRYRGPSIAAGAAHLLVVGFERPGNVEVDHGLDVRPIDAHPERVGGTDDAQPAGGEVVLDLRPRRIRQPGVIRGRGGARVPQRLGRAFRLFPCGGIDERASAGDQLRQDLVLLPFTRDRTHAQLDIGTVESGHNDTRRREPQQVDDVVADFGCGRRGKRRNGRTAGLAVAAAARGGRRPEPPVIRPEVVPPLRDAVRLVDDEPGHAQLA